MNKNILLIFVTSFLILISCGSDESGGSAGSGGPGVNTPNETITIEAIRGTSLTEIVYIDKYLIDPAADYTLNFSNNQNWVDFDQSGDEIISTITPGLDLEDGKTYNELIKINQNGKNFFLGIKIFVLEEESIGSISVDNSGGDFLFNDEAIILSFEKNEFQDFTDVELVKINNNNEEFGYLLRSSSDKPIFGSLKQITNNSPPLNTQSFEAKVITPPPVPNYSWDNVVGIFDEVHFIQYTFLYSKPSYIINQLPYFWQKQNIFRSSTGTKYVSNQWIVSRTELGLSTSGLLLSGINNKILPAKLRKLYKIKGDINLNNKKEDFDSGAIILVHGYEADPGIINSYGGGSTWGKLGELLAEKGYTVYQFDWLTHSSYEAAAGDLKKAIDKIYKDTKKPITIVAHSFGGLLARTYLQNIANNGYNSIEEKVRALITLSTPHSGVSRNGQIVSNEYDINPTTLPVGSDSILNSLCNQFSCYQAAATRQSLILSKAFKHNTYVYYNILRDAEVFFPDYHATKDNHISPAAILYQPGSIIHYLYNDLRNKGFPVPTLNLIGITTKGDKTQGKIFDNGDKLISFAGQRFSPDLGLSSIQSMKTNPHSDKVIEKVLGISSTTSYVSPKEKVAFQDNAFEGFYHTSLQGEPPIAKIDNDNHPTIQEINNWILKHTDSNIKIEQFLTGNYLEVDLPAGSSTTLNWIISNDGGNNKPEANVSLYQSDSSGFDLKTKILEFEYDMSVKAPNDVKREVTSKSITTPSDPGIYYYKVCLSDSNCSPNYLKINVTSLAKHHYTISIYNSNTTVSDNLGKFTNCLASCKASYQEGENIILTFTPNQRYQIDTLNGCDSTTSNSCFINNITSDRSINVAASQTITQVCTPFIWSNKEEYPIPNGTAYGHRQCSSDGSFWGDLVFHSIMKCNPNFTPSGQNCVSTSSLDTSAPITSLQRSDSNYETNSNKIDLELAIWENNENDSGVYAYAFKQGTANPSPSEWIVVAVGDTFLKNFIKTVTFTFPDYGEYSLRAWGKDRAGKISYRSRNVTYVEPIRIPGKLSNLKVKAKYSSVGLDPGKYNEYILTWDIVPYASYYEVYRSCIKVTYITGAKRCKKMNYEDNGKNITSNIFKEKLTSDTRPSVSKYRVRGCNEHGCGDYALVSNTDFDVTL